MQLLNVLSENPSPKPYTRYGNLLVDEGEDSILTPRVPGCFWLAGVWQVRIVLSWLPAYEKGNGTYLYMKD